MAQALRSDRRAMLATVLVPVVVLAWIALWAWGRSPYAAYLSHETIEQASLAQALILVGGWTLMTVAMMLPTSLPLVRMFDSMTSARPDHGRLTGLMLAGYLASWTLFGLAVHQGDRVLHDVVHRTAWLEARPSLIGAGIFALAGAFQFSPLKYRCLDKCRSPMMFLTEHWLSRGRSGSGAFRLGVRHGLFCVGCCWALMLLMFAVGVGSVGWMLSLGAVMAVEKNVAWGRRLSAPLGAVLLTTAAVVAVAGA